MVSVEVKESGLDVAWISSTEVKSGHPPKLLTLPDRHFGPEYGRDLYNLVIVNSFLFLSVENGVVVINFTTVNGTFEAKPSFHILDWPETERLPCQPTAVFFPSLINHFVACVDVTDSGDQSIHFVELNLDLDNLTASTLNPTPIYSEPLTKPISLTNFIGDADTGCHLIDPLNHIVFANNYIVKDYSIQNMNVNEFQVSEQCLLADSLEYFGGDTLLVRCPSNIAERFDLCDQNTIQLYSENVTGIPYPCGSWDTVAYLQSGGIFIESRGLQAWPDDWTLSDVTHAECAAVDDKVFIAFLIEDRVVVMETGSATTFHTLANTSCLNSSQCFKPHIWENRLIGYTNGSDFLVKDLYCLMDPAIIVLDSNPRVVEVVINEIPPSVECAIKPAPLTSPNPPATEPSDVLENATDTTVLPTPLASPNPPVTEPPDVLANATYTTVLPTPLASPNPPVTEPPDVLANATDTTVLPTPLASPNPPVTEPPDVLANATYTTVLPTPLASPNPPATEPPDVM